MLGAGVIAKAMEQVQPRCQESDNPSELVCELIEVKAQICQ